MGFRGGTEIICTTNWDLYSESIKGLYKNWHYIISHDNNIKLTTIIIQQYLDY